MSGATFPVYKTFIAGEVLTASDLNASLTTIINNLNPAGMDDYSSDVTEMRVVTDPYPAGAESLATSSQGELERLRYQIKAITGEAQWYIDPDNSLLSTSKPTYAGLTATGAIDEAADTIAAHATTCDIWSKPNNITLTGDAVTFTDFSDAPQAGAVRWIKSNAAHVLTNNANLIVQGGSNVTLAIGDWFRVEAITTTTFNILVFRADGTALTASATASQLAKAWINFDGTGTVTTRSSMGISSVADYGTGIYCVAFAAEMPDANFVVVASGQFKTGLNLTIPGFHMDGNSTTGCQVQFLNIASELNDSTFCTLVFYR